MPQITAENAYQYRRPLWPRHKPLPPNNVIIVNVTLTDTATMLITFDTFITTWNGTGNVQARDSVLGQPITATLLAQNDPQSIFAFFSQDIDPSLPWTIEDLSDIMWLGGLTLPLPQTGSIN